MTTFLFSYRAPHGYQGSPQAREAWEDFFASMGDAVVDRGNPAFVTSSVGECSASTALGGYSLITAEDLDAALSLAAMCPFVAAGGGVEVGELTPLNAEVSR